MVLLFKYLYKQRLNPSMLKQVCGHWDKDKKFLCFQGKQAL